MGVLGSAVADSPTISRIGTAAQWAAAHLAGWVIPGGQVVAVDGHPVVGDGTSSPATLASRSRIGYNPMNYGCAFDGVTDDAAALTNFFAQRSSRDVVQFPSGRTARLGTAVSIGPEFTGGRLYGNNATLKLGPGAVAYANVANLLAPGLTIRDLRVDVSGLGQGTGLHAKADDQQILDCEFIDAHSGAVYIVGSTVGLDIIGNRFSGAGYGVLFHDAATTTHVSISRNRFVGGSTGDAIEVNTPNGQARYVTISGNHIRGYTATSGSGIGIGVAHASNVSISGNVVVGTGLDGIHVEDASHAVLIADNQVSGVTGSSPGIAVLSGVGVSGDGDQTAMVSVHGNVVTACAAGGIAVHGTGGAGAAHYSVLGNKILGCGTAASSTFRNGILVGFDTLGTIVALNHVLNTKGDAQAAGIRVDSATALCTGNYLGDDQATKTQKYGIRATGTAVVNVRDNIDAGNATAMQNATETATFVTA